MGASGEGSVCWVWTRAAFLTTPSQFTSIILKKIDQDNLQKWTFETKLEYINMTIFHFGWTIPLIIGLCGGFALI